MRKPNVNTASKNRGYFRQALDMGEKSPKLTTKNARNLGEWVQAKADDENEKAKKEFREKKYPEIINKLSTNKWKTDGIYTEDADLRDALDKGHINYKEYQKGSTLISRRLLEAKKLKVIQREGDDPIDGAQLVTGRQYVPYQSPVDIKYARKERYRQAEILQNKVAQENPLSAPSLAARDISNIAGGVAGLGLGAIRTAANAGSIATDFRLFDDAKNLFDEGERKYYAGAEKTGKENIFLESMYGASAGTEQILAAPFVWGGQAGKYTVGRGLGMLSGQSAQTSNDVYDTLGIMDWYREKTGDETNLTRQVWRQAAKDTVVNALSAGAGMATMNVAGNIFANALRPVAGSMIGFNKLKTVGMFLPSATSALGTSGVPGQAVRGLGGTAEQGELANQVTSFMGSPIEGVVGAIPMTARDENGNVIDINQQERAIKQQTDPYGVSEFATTMAMFSGGTASFYKDAKKLYQVSRMLSRVGAKEPGKFAQAGQRLARQKAELIGAVGPDAMFAMNNVLQPAAQTYRAATDKTKDQEGNLLYQAPTLLDLAKATVLTFGATRPHKSVSPIIQPVLRGKPLMSGVDINAQAYYMARDYVDGGDWRSTYVNKRFADLTGNKDAHPDDVRRVASAIYEMVKTPAMEEMSKGRMLPQHAIEGMFIRLAEGKGIQHETGEVSQAEVNKLISSMRKKGDKNPLPDDSPLLQHGINPKLYATDPAARKTQITELQKHIAGELQKQVQQSQAPADATGKPEDVSDVAPESTGNKFYAVRIEDTEDGTPQYIAYNSHKTGYGHTFRSAEIVKGDQDISDLIDISSAANMAKNRLHTAENLARVVATNPDVMNPLGMNRWTSENGESTRTIGGFKTDGGVIVKNYNSVDGSVTEEVLPSTQVAREIGVLAPKLAAAIGSHLEAMNSTKTELAEIPDFYESVDFPDKVSYTSKDGSTRDVNGRLISTFGVMDPIGVFQLQDGSIYVQPVRDQGVRTKAPLTSRQIDSSSEAINAKTLAQAQRTIEASEGYIDLDVHNMGVPTRMLLSPEQIELARTIMESELPDADKAMALRNAIAESIALDTPPNSKAYRISENGEVVQDAELLPGDVIIGHFDPLKIGDDGQKGVVIKTDGRLVTVKLLSDPEGLGYTAPIDQVVIDTHHDRTEMNKRLSEFVPSEETPTLRPFKRAMADEEELAIFVATKNAVTVQKEIKQASAEQLPDIIKTYVRDARSMPQAVKSGLIMWAVTNQNTEAVIDAMVAVYDDAMSESTPNIHYLHQVANLYNDARFIDTLYTIDDLNTSLPKAGLFSARSIQDAATTRAIARRMNQIMLRSDNKIGPAEAYRKAVKSLGITPERNSTTERDAKAESVYMRGIAPQAVAHIETMWHMKRLSGLNLDAQVRLGRAITVISDTVAARKILNDAGLPAMFVDFWRGENYYNQSLTQVRNLVNAETTETAGSTEKALRSVGLDFLYYAAGDRDQVYKRNLLSKDLDAFKAFQKESGLYIANSVIPKIIIDAIGESVENSQFLGFTKDGKADQTNQLSFLSVLAKYGREIGEVIARSEIPEIDRESIVNAMFELLSQVEENPAIAERVATYDGSDNGNGVDTVLRNGNSVTNLTAVESMQSVNKAADEIMDHAVVDEFQSADKSSKRIIGDEELTETEKAQLAMEENDITGLRKLNVQRLTNIKNFTQVVNALSTFKITDVNTLLDKYAHLYGWDVAQEALALAEESGDKDAINAARDAEVEPRRNTFLAAFRHLDNIISNAKQLSLLYMDGDVHLDENFESALGQLENAYDSLQSFYTQAAISHKALLALGDSDVARGKLVSQDEDGTSTEATTFGESDDKSQIAILQNQIRAINADSTIPIATKREQIAILQQAIKTFSAKVEDQQKGGTIQEKFITALNNFNNAVVKVPQPLLEKFADAPQDVLAIQLNIMQNMYDSLISDPLREMGTARSIAFGENSVRMLRQVTRMAKEQLTFLSDAMKSQEVSIDVANGEVSINIFGQKRNVQDIEKIGMAIDRDNPDVVKINPDTNVADAMFVSSAIDPLLAEFLDDDPSVVTYAISSDTGFDGMVVHEQNAAERANLLAMHARNYAGMREILSKVLTSELELASSDTSFEKVKLFGDSQVQAINPLTVVSPVRNSNLGDVAINTAGALDAAQNKWRNETIRTFDRAVKDGIAIEGGEKIVASVADEKAVKAVNKRINDLFKNLNVDNAKFTASELATSVRMILQTELTGKSDFQKALLSITKPDALVSQWAKIDRTGTYASFRAGYNDVPHQIATTLKALSEAGNEAVAFTTNASGRHSIFSEPAEGQLKALKPATAKLLYDMYNQIDTSEYTNQTQVESIDRIKGMYRQVMSDAALRPAKKLAGDLNMVNQLATGLAKLYDNFAFGHANDKLSMLLGSQQPQHRIEVINGLRAVGAREQVVQAFIQNSSLSFAQFMGATKALTPEQVNAFRAYMIARGRQDYYLNSGRVLFTTKKIMSLSNVAMRDHLGSGKAKQQVYGATLNLQNKTAKATHKLLMIASDMSADRNAATLAHEVGHVLFHGVSDGNQMRLLESLLPMGAEFLSRINETHPLYPVMTQLEAAREYRRKFGTLDLEAAWANLDDVDGISLKQDWHPFAHETFVSGFLTTLSNFEAPIANNAAMSIDRDAAAIFQEVGGPLRAAWKGLARTSPADILRTADGKFQQQWTSPIPFAKYNTGRRTVSYPQLRQGDYVSLNVPPKGRLDGRPYVHMYSPKDMVRIWIDSGFGTGVGQTYGYEHVINGRKINSPFKDQTLTQLFVDKVRDGSYDPRDFWFTPIHGATKNLRLFGEDDSMQQRYAFRLQGRVVDQVVAMDPRFNQGKFSTAFVDNAMGATITYVSVAQDGGIDKDGFFPTHLHLRDRDVAEGRYVKTSTKGIAREYESVPLKNSYYVLEVPVTLRYGTGKTGLGRNTTVRMLVSSEALADLDGTTQPRLHGYSGEYNSKFSAVLYDINRRVSQVQKSLVGLSDYSDQVALEKKILTGTSVDFQGNRPASETAADRIGAYFADQFKHVRAAGVDMRGMMKVGRASVEADIFDHMMTQGLINDEGGITLEGTDFLNRLNDNAINPVGDFIYNNGLFRMSIGRDQMMYDSRFAYDDATSQFILNVDAPEYKGLVQFFDQLNNALDNKTTDPDARQDMLEQFAYDMYYAFAKPLTGRSTRADRNASMHDRIANVVTAFNEGLPDELKLATTSVQDYNGQPTAIDALSAMEMPIRGNNVGDFFTQGYPLQMLDIMDTVMNGQELRFSDNYYRSTGAAYAMSRVRDVVFGRNNVAGYSNFLKQLADPNPAVNEKASQLLYATAHILDLQEREMSSARYNWKSQKYTLVSNSFKTQKQLLMKDGAGGLYNVDFALNQSRPVVVDPSNPLTLLKGDVLGNRYPITTPGYRMKYQAAPQGSVPEGLFDINTLSPVEKTNFLRDGSVVIMRNTPFHNPSLERGIYLYRITSPVRMKIVDPRAEVDTSVPYSVQLLSNPFLSYRAVTDDNGTITQLQSVQEYRQQSASDLIRLAAQAYMPDASSDTYERIDNLAQNSIVPHDVFVAKMLVAEAEHDDPSVIPAEWRTKMGTDYRVSKIIQPDSGAEIDITQSAIVNNARKGTWLSSGDIFEDAIDSFTQEEMDLVDGLEPYDPNVHSDPEAFSQWRQQRYTDIVDKMFVVGEPDRLILKNDPDNNQIGISVDGKDVYMSIPTADFDSVGNTLFSSGSSTTPFGITPGQLRALQYRVIPGRTRLNRFLNGAWTELNATNIVQRLSLDFARPFLQNFMVAFMDPKNSAMQFYGLAGLAPNFTKPGAQKMLGTTPLQRLASFLLGHSKETAYGDKAYHAVIGGLFNKYGTPGSKIGAGIPFVQQRTVGGKYVKPVISGVNMPERAYTIADLNEMGLSTQYGEWYEAASAMNALNPAMAMEDIPIQLSQSEFIGKGVIAQRYPLVGATERAGVMSTDILRIKMMLEYAAYIDDNLPAFALGDDASRGQMEYVATQYKKNYARILNTLTGVPAGTDPGLNPKLQEKYYTASQLYTAPNWFKAVGNITLVPAALQLASGMMLNNAMRPILKKFDGGIGYNVIDVGPQARFFDALQFNTPKAGTRVFTPGAEYLRRVATALIGLSSLHYINNEVIAQASKAAIAKKAGQHISDTIWTQIAGVDEENAMMWTVKPKPIIDKNNLRATGRVRTIGDVQINYPAAIMGFQKFIVTPALNIDQSINEGMSAPAAIAKEMTKLYFLDRLNPMYGTMRGMYTGQEFDGKPSFQKHPGMEYLRANKDQLLSAMRGHPYELVLRKLLMQYPNGASRMAIDHEIIPIQNFLRELEQLIYRSPDLNLEYDPKVTNLRMNMFGRLIGIENAYRSPYVDDIAELKILKTSGGAALKEMMEYQYDYPNAIDMINAHGLSSLWEGIPDSGDVTLQDIKYPGMPTSPIIFESTDRTERLRARQKRRYKKNFETLSNEQIQKIIEEVGP